MTKERAMEIARMYIENDVVNAEICYVKDVLDMIGVTEDEAKELGLDYLFDE